MTFVSMNEHAEVAAAGRIYTDGLCGCRCTVAKRGDRIQLAHYCPLSTGRHIAALRAFQPEEVAMWTPGEWSKQGERWVMEAQSVPPGLQELCTVAHGYSVGVTIGEARTVVYLAGRVYAFGIPVALPWGPVSIDKPG